MEFNPNSKIVKLCLQGLELHGKGKPEEADVTFRLAWEEAGNNFEKFFTAHFIARHQQDIREKLNWFETSLDFALKINDITVEAAFPSLYANIAACYKELNDSEKAQKNQELASSFHGIPSDKGPFYHGTRADLKIGDVLTPGSVSNYDSTITMNHIYFTALVNGAGLAASLAKGEGQERVYKVEPTGSFENDPNVTDKKFPGNLTRSYRSREPLKIIGEVSDWLKISPENLQEWKDKLKNNKGKIIN